MQTAVVNFKTEPRIKKEAQKVAKNLGFTLSGLLEGYLRHLIRTKEVHFRLDETPNKYMKQALKESVEDIKAGRVVSFKDTKDALKYLEKISNESNHKKSRLLKKVPKGLQKSSSKDSISL